MKKLLAATAIMMSMSVQAEVLDMVPLITFKDGNHAMVERFMWEYGSKSDNWKYFGAYVIIYDEYGNSKADGKMYIDCSDGTYGGSTPTTENIIPNTMSYALYEKACIRKEVKSVF